MHHVLSREVRHHRSHERAHPRALLEIPKLSHRVARGSSGDRRDCRHTALIGAVTNTALNCLASSRGHEFLAFGKATHRHVSNESSPRIAHVYGAFRMLRYFDDAVTQWHRESAPSIRRWWDVPGAPPPLPPLGPTDGKVLRRSNRLSVASPRR